MIISVPTIFSCKLPSGGWVNLAQIRQIEIDPPTGVVITTWVNGEKQRFDGENATAILQTWEQAAQRCTCHGNRDEYFDDEEVYE
ncbi:hypothetical protein NIES2109_34120 [Nostoc sp. HK-01]|nr:hypothetical protein NIES2109_34120 [Nostoc sp. HK-01]